METFHWIVIGIALFFLILILVLVGMMMNSQNKNNIFPPVKQSCPNGWVNDYSGNCFYVGQNGGTGFDLSANKTMYYKGENIYPIYVNNQSDNGTPGTTTAAIGWYNYYGNKGLTTTPPVSGTPSNISTTPTSTNYGFLNPNDKAWESNGSTGLCQQKRFANNNNIFWDGVSNTNQC